MSHPCESFRSELEAASSRGTRGLERLAAAAHARDCPACRALVARELALERLLDSVPRPEAPPALARRVLAAVATERRAAPALEERELDELLERVPAPRVPPGLGRRVLAGLAPARAPRRRRAGLVWLAAAAVLIAAALWAWRARAPEVPAPDVVESENLEGDEDLLAYAFERWEELHDDDLDLWLASLDPLDELLLEYAEEEWPEAGSTGGGGGF